MDALKLLIADDNEEFRQALAEALQDMYYIRTCRTGKEAMSLLRAFGPDGLVLNLMLPEMDGISLLENAVRSGIRPMVLATTPLDNDYVVESVSRLGVEYLMRRPCDVPSTVARIRDLSRRLKSPEPQIDPVSYVSSLLLSLNVSTKHDGFAYLAEEFGIEIVEAIEEESGAEASAKELIHLIEEVRHHDIGAIFVEENGSGSAAAIIAAETGAKCGTLHMAMSGTDYFEAMYANIDALKEALK